MVNTRELALIVWSVVVLGFVLRNSEVRKAFGGVISAVFNPRLIAVFMLAFAYLVVGLWVWSLLGFFNTGQIKAAVLWALFGAPVALARVGTEETKPGAVKAWVADTFKITVLIEFIAHFYSFHIAVELLLVPISTLLVVLVAFAGNKPEYAQIRRVLNGLLTLFGGFLVVFGIYSALRNLSDFANAETLRDMYTTPLLALWMVPFLYLTFLYARYGSAHSMARIYIADSKLRDFAFAYAMIAFHVRTGLLRRWSQKIAELSPRNREDVKTSIKVVLRADHLNRTRQTVPSESGWDPVVAGAFLLDVELPTADYHESYGDWFSESTMLAITDSWPPDYMKYSVNGLAGVAHRLHLKLYVNGANSEATALTAYNEAASTLLAHALAKEDLALLDAGFDPTIEGRVFLVVSSIEVERTLHSSPDSGGYDLSLQVRRGSQASIGSGTSD